MTMEVVARWVVAASCGVCAGGCLWLLGMGAQALYRTGPAPMSLPLALRMLWRPAGLLAPGMAGLLPAPVRNRLHASLARCDLDVLSPEGWLAIRLLHGLLALLATASILVSLRLPVGVFGAVALVLGCCWGGHWLRRWRTRRATAILKQLPAYLDLLTLCVESGASLTTGLRLAVDKSPPGPLRQVFERVLREIRSGSTRVDAFARVARIYDLECLSALTSALIHSEGSGMSLGAVLRAQSQQRTAERFTAAERLAMQAPVKMLGPLILCIFPCTFVVIAVPIAVRLAGVTSQ